MVIRTIAMCALIRAVVTSFLSRWNAGGCGLAYSLEGSRSCGYLSHSWTIMFFAILPEIWNSQRYETTSDLKLTRGMKSWKVKFLEMWNFQRCEITRDVKSWGVKFLEIRNSRRCEITRYENLRCEIPWGMKFPEMWNSQRYEILRCETPLDVKFPEMWNYRRYEILRCEFF